MAKQKSGILLLVLLALATTTFAEDSESSTESSVTSSSTTDSAVTSSSATDSTVTSSSTTDSAVTTDTSKTTATDDTSPDSSVSNEPTPTSSVPTTTQEPLTGKRLFEETKTVLNSIDISLDKFNDALNRTAAPETMSPGLFNSKVRGRFSSRIVEDDVEICSMDIDPCTAIKASMNAINTLLNILQGTVENWSDAYLRNLKENQKSLESGVDDIGESIEMFNENASQEIEKTKDLVDKASSAADAKIDEYKKEETDSIIFVAVLGSVGGVMVVALIATTALHAVKKKPKKAAKGKKQVREERTPGSDFIDAHEAQPRYAAYAGPSRGGPAEDPYARGYGPRNPQDTRSPFATGHSSGLPRNY